MRYIKLDIETFKEKAVGLLKDIYPNIELKKEDLDLQYVLHVMRDYYQLTNLVRPI